MIKIWEMEHKLLAHAPFSIIIKTIIIDGSKCIILRQRVNAETISVTRRNFIYKYLLPSGIGNLSSSCCDFCDLFVCVRCSGLWALVLF